MVWFYLLASIILGSLGYLAIVASGDPNAPWWMSWVSWFIFTPAFIALFLTMDTFGVAGAFSLWGAGTAIIAIYQGIRWGDRMSTGQIISGTTIILSMIWFGLGA